MTTTNEEEMYWLRQYTYMECVGIEGLRSQNCTLPQQCGVPEGLVGRSLAFPRVECELLQAPLWSSQFFLKYTKDLPFPLFSCYYSRSSETSPMDVAAYGVILVRLMVL